MVDTEPEDHDSDIKILPAQPSDTPLILDMVMELAEYENDPAGATVTPKQIHDGLFGDNPSAECVIALFTANRPRKPSGCRTSQPDPA